MQMRKLAILFLIFTSFVEAPYAQVCRRESIPESTPTERFKLIADGTAEDKYTGLFWHRCPLGQTLIKGANGAPECEGQPYFESWDGALRRANAIGGGWRLPNIKELASIVDVQCFDPPFNRAIFPAAWSIPENAAEVVGYWSSTPGPAYINHDPKLPPALLAWGLLLNHGYTGRYSLVTPMMMLLVRNP